MFQKNQVKSYLIVVEFLPPMYKLYCGLYIPGMHFASIILHIPMSRPHETSLNLVMPRDYWRSLQTFPQMAHGLRNVI